MTLSKNSLENLFVYWLEISKSKLFIGNLIGVCSTIGNSLKFMCDLYQ